MGRSSWIGWSLGIPTATDSTQHPLLSVKIVEGFIISMNKQQIQEVVYSIRDVYERRIFTTAEFSSILIGSGFKSKERSLIIRRSLMWGYLVKCSNETTLIYKIVDIDKAVRTRTLHKGRHGMGKVCKTNLFIK